MTHKRTAVAGTGAGQCDSNKRCRASDVLPPRDTAIYPTAQSKDEFESHVGKAAKVFSA